MDLINRKCPNCKTNVPLGYRLKFVFGRILDCPGCNYKIQPTIIWGLVTAAMFSFFSYFFFYRSIEDLWGSNIASVSIIVIALLTVKVFEPFADLTAHHEDETLY